MTVQGLLPSHEQEPHGVSPASQVLHVEFTQRLVAVNPVQGLLHGKLDFCVIRSTHPNGIADPVGLFPDLSGRKGVAAGLSRMRAPWTKSRQASSPTPGRAKCACRSEAEQRPYPPQWDSGCAARPRDVVPPNGSSQECKIYTLTFTIWWHHGSVCPLAPQQDPIGS